MKETKETVYNVYVRELCSICQNKNNEQDLCVIRKCIDGTIKCINYKRV